LERVTRGEVVDLTLKESKKKRKRGAGAIRVRKGGNEPQNEHSEKGGWRASVKRKAKNKKLIISGE